MGDFGLGLAQGTVTLVPYNAAWTEAFTVESALIKQFVPSAIEVQHIGSTSIPGIRSKPILDIMVGVAKLEEGPSLEPLMALLGYDFARHAGVPNDHVFGKGIERTHLVHVVEHHGHTWSHNLRFRDRLRNDSALAREYETLKVTLASRYAESRADYTAAKQEFINHVVAMSADTTNHSPP